MPRGRFLDRDLSTNRQYWSLSVDCRNFWDLLIIWLDPLGRMDGDARIIKGIVCPLADWTIDDIEQMLLQFEGLKRNNGLGWIVRYNSHGIHCLWASGFKDHQKGLQVTHEAKGKYDGYSNIPPPTASLLKKAETEIPPSPKEIKNGERESAFSLTVVTAHDTVEQDLKIATMIKYYEEQIGKTLSHADYDNLKDFADTYPDGWFEKAVDEAKAKNARSPIPYIAKVLETRFKEGKTPVRSTPIGNKDTMEEE